MVSKTVLLCLFILSVTFIECKRSGGSSGGRSSSRSRGSSSSSHSYPSSSSGLSGSGSLASHSYPVSSSGLSGKKKFGTSGSSYNTYRSYNTDSGFKLSHNIKYYPPNYYTARQRVIVHEYRKFVSPYSDLLTGLTLYNLDRSYHHHKYYYYNDYYYRHRYFSGSGSSAAVKSMVEAVCSLKIVTKDGRKEALEVPCEAVSTFTDGGTEKGHSEGLYNIVCRTNITDVTVNDVLHQIMSNPATSGSLLNEIELSMASVNQQVKKTYPREDTTRVTSKLPANFVLVSNDTFSDPKSQVNIQKYIISSKGRTNSISVNIITNISTYVEIDPRNFALRNPTVCTSLLITKDPLKVSGPPLNGKYMTCTVEIKTAYKFITSLVDCRTLEEYSKMRKPPVTSISIPPKEKLKSWLSNPPWWLSLIIAG